ncbi:MAG: hypothetical protein KC588_04900 [Nitrospira sp.]|nr:hypothetical protein [Nitrospira sp.]
MFEEIMQPLFPSGRAAKCTWQSIKDFRRNGEVVSVIGCGSVAGRGWIER